ncbi:MAG: hypothetical protein OEW45_11545, partial [Deltaproteobacteria bacterium]|nr:hypothetical protein [Deltaproteobacteria bacterium]
NRFWLGCISQKLSCMASEKATRYEAGSKGSMADMIRISKPHHKVGVNGLFSYGWESEVSIFGQSKMFLARFIAMPVDYVP